MTNTHLFLIWLKDVLDSKYVTNLKEQTAQFGVDSNLATILKSLEIVKKTKAGFWEWNDSDPDEEMAVEVRETANIYKNYAY